MTVAANDFRPRWASPPGDSIRAALVELDWSDRDLALALEIDDAAAEGLLDGSVRVTVDLARKLAAAVGGTPRFWLSRDARYRESLEWVAADSWVSLLPTKDMAQLGWLERASDWREAVSVCMDFFGVESPGGLGHGWTQAHAARFRAKPKDLTEDAAIAAWVRRVELEAKEVECASWDAEALEAALPDLAELSRQRDPGVFVPELQRRCAERGVALVVVRSPRGCPVSGVSMTLASGVRVIGLSGRYLADDHFWFTLMHEIGHLLLHDGELFVDDIDRDTSSVDDETENQADAFASDVLLPPHLRIDIHNPSPLAVRSIARKAGVSEGVVVGQLQHVGAISFKSRMNRLKRRYEWRGTEFVSGT